MTYRDLLGELDEWFARGVADAGPGVVLCQRGCSACCLGPFDISPADAELVASAVDRLDPAIRSMVQLRAADQVAQYHELASSWSPPWDPGAIGDRKFDWICNRLAKARCPALGDNGACLIYEDRPATCRMIGLPMKTRENDLLENNCPIKQTSAVYAVLGPTIFDLHTFEEKAEDEDIAAMERGWRRTTVAGAIEQGEKQLRHSGNGNGETT